MAIIRHGYSDGSERRERSKLYNSSAWKKASKIVMVRASGRCEWCGREAVDAVHLTESTLDLVRSGDALKVVEIAGWVPSLPFAVRGGPAGCPSKPPETDFLTPAAETRIGGSVVTGRQAVEAIRNAMRPTDRRIAPAALRPIQHALLWPLCVLGVPPGTSNRLVEHVFDDLTFADRLPCTRGES